ncbi:MAG: hypothetical protein M1409_09940 [Actinobacteria bacterium]|nr:hypothetical protein [Actinomycetota bacterium]
MYNRNLWDIELSPWALSVMNEDGMAIIPQEPFEPWENKITPVRPMVLWGYTLMDDPKWIWGNKYIQLRQEGRFESMQKLGILNTLGWIAYYLNGELFVKRYRYYPEASYPDFGVNTEIFTNSEMLELETLGSLKKIPPDGFTEHFESWSVFKVNIDGSEESINKNILPLIESTDKFLI